MEKTNPQSIKEMKIQNGIGNSNILRMYWSNINPKITHMASITIVIFKKALITSFIIFFNSLIRYKSF